MLVPDDLTSFTVDHRCYQPADRCAPTPKDICTPIVMGISWPAAMAFTTAHGRAVSEGGMEMLLTGLWTEVL